VNAPAIPLWGAAALIVLCGVTVACAVYAAACSHWLQLRTERYVESLDAPLRRMLQPARGRLILSLQLTLVPLVIGCAVGLSQPALSLLAALIVLLPGWAIAYARRKRRARIDSKLDTFALALANATRATPSVGRALQILQTSLAKPLDAEVGQVLRELRVGSSLDQALLNFSWRVESSSLDALLSSVLIARRVGGNLPDVLETTANTLREMARLEGVLRSKTAQARMQMWVLGALPPVIVWAYSSAQPGYFAPLMASALGMVLIAVALAAYLSAILLARRILAVEL